MVSLRRTTNAGRVAPSACRLLEFLGGVRVCREYLRTYVVAFLRAIRLLFARDESAVFRIVSFFRGIVHFFVVVLTSDRFNAFRRFTWFVACERRFFCAVQEGQVGIIIRVFFAQFAGSLRTVGRLFTAIASRIRPDVLFRDRNC